MKHLPLLLTVAVCVLGVTVASASQYGAYTELPPDTQPNPDVNGPELPPTSELLTLTFYNDQGVFLAAFPCVTFENFALTNVPGNSVMACDGPFNAATNNTCFSPGDIVPGVEVDNLGVAPDNLNVVLTPPFAGVPFVSVGPNTFVTDGVIRLNPGVEAFGMDILSPRGPFPVQVNVYSGATLLGSTNVTWPVSPAFWGVSSDADPITRIETIGGDGELYTNMLFGTCGVPVEPATWGMIKSTFGE